MNSKSVLESIISSVDAGIGSELLVDWLGCDEGVDEAIEVIEKRDEKESHFDPTLLHDEAELAGVHYRGRVVDAVARDDRPVCKSVHVIRYHGQVQGKSYNVTG